MVTSAQHVHRAHVVALVAAVIVVIGGLTVCVGWLTSDSELVQGILRSTRLVRPDTALVFTICGLAIISSIAKWPRWIGLTCAAIVCLVGVQDILEALIPTWLNVADALLPDTPLKASAEVSRVSVILSVTIVALGIAVALLTLNRGPNLRPAIGAFSGLLGLATNLGLILGVQPGVDRLANEAALITPGAGIALILVGISLITVRIEVGWPRVQISGLAGGRMSRVLIPSIIGVVFLSSFIVQSTILVQGADPRFGFEISVMLITTLTLAVAFFVAFRIDRVDGQRESTLQQLRDQLSRADTLRLMTTQLSFARPDPQTIVPLGLRIALDGLPAANCCAYLELSNGSAQPMLTLNDVSHRDDAGAALVRTLLATPVELGNGLTQRVLKTPAGIALPTISDAEIKAIIPQQFWPYVDRFGVGAGAAVRVDIESAPAGVLIITSPTERSLDDVGLAFLEEVSRILGLSLTGARFYAQLQQTNQTLEARVLARTTELETARNELNSVLQSAPDAIYTIDVDGKIVSANEAAGRMFGYPPEAMVGKNLVDLSPADDQEATRERLARTVETGVSAFIGNALAERELVRKNGERFVVQTTAGEVKGSTPADTYFTLVTRDISIQVAAEQRLRVAEERFRSAFDNAPIGMSLANLNGAWFRVKRSLV